MNKVNPLSKDFKNNEFDSLFEGDDKPAQKTIIKRNIKENEEKSLEKEFQLEINTKAPTQRNTFEGPDTDRDDIVIQRRKKNGDLLTPKEVPPKESSKRENTDESSVMEEQEDRFLSPTKVSMLRPVDSKPISMESHNRSSSGSGYNFRNNKKITSLDELYVQNHFFCKNPKNPFTESVMNFGTEGLVIDVFEARYLPDTVNFVRVKGLIYGETTGMEGSLHKGMLQIDGDINSVFFDLSIKIESLKSSHYDDMYLFLFWETFQDIFGEDDVEFAPVVFGFSLVKLFQAEGVKSLASCVGFFEQEMASLRRPTPDPNIPSLLSEARPKLNN